ncbi:polyprenol phosphomannose-dependent alpha 1,6 mannosyltransferase MptB [Catenuloplanes japonicus]|uniref:polyprenol phosphomannose-dependent alpha 1,6 mannosyltransferase MptB n=1 Tax=Catenuloplanes japonicus TaxID=33876 RepID=UPI000527EA56|nr:polyprenol phosphomannose-dependent alpha 1,6 mannosyltransferase MptB [Catenuloplanes japonicus]
MRLLGFLSAALLAGGAWWAGALPAGHRTGPAGPFTVALIVCLIGLAGLVACWLRVARGLPSSASFSPSPPRSSSPRRSSLPLPLRSRSRSLVRLPSPVRSLLVTGVLWQLPFLFAPPIGSRDVYSYACQGWIYARSLDPYVTSPRAADCPWLPGVAELWQDATTPYGPFALLISGLAGFSGSWLVALVVLRLCALAGLALAAAGVWQLASSFGFDATRAVWIGLPAPLIAVHAVSGAHHDALLAGLLLVALAWSLRPSPAYATAAGIALGLAAAIKITALAALPFVLILALRGRRSRRAAQLSSADAPETAAIAASGGPGGLRVPAGTDSGTAAVPVMGESGSLRVPAGTDPPAEVAAVGDPEPVRSPAAGDGRVGRGPVAVAGGLVGSFALVTLVSGLGFGWLAALTSSTGPKQWTSVPTGVGMAVGYLLRAAGLGAHEETALAVARLAGIVALAAVGLICLWGAWKRRADPRAVVLRAGVVLLAVVVLGPVAYPWYFLTPVPVLAAALTTERHLRRLAYGGAFVSLLVLPDGLGIPALTKAPGAIADLLLVATALVLAIRRTRRPSTTASRDPA